jgi:hypothetical protein
MHLLLYRYALEIEDFGIVAKKLGSVSDNFGGDHIKIFNLSGPQVSQDSSQPCTKLVSLCRTELIRASERREYSVIYTSVSLWDGGDGKIKPEIISFDKPTRKPYAFEVLEFTVGIVANSTCQLVATEFFVWIDLVTKGKRSEPTRYLLFVSWVKTECTKMLEGTLIGREELRCAGRSTWFILFKS